MKKGAVHIEHAEGVTLAAPSTSSPTVGDFTSRSPAGLLTPQAVQQMLAISKWELQKMVQRKEIPHFRIGYRTIRFDPKEIKAWIEKKRVAVNPLAAIRVRRAMIK